MADTRSTETGNNLITVEVALGSIQQTREEFIRDKEVAVTLCGRNTVMTAENIGKENADRKFVKSKKIAATVKCDEVPNICDDDHDDKFGVIFVDQYETLFGAFRMESGHLEIIYKVSVVPPKRQGGLTRYGLLRVVKHKELMQKTAEVANKLFINSETGQVNVSGGLIVGGTDIGFTFLQNRNLSFDPRIAAKIQYKVGSRCEGEEGLEEAVEEWCFLHC